MAGSQNQPPTAATDAVLVSSDEMPKDAQKVEELDFNKLKRPITAEDLLDGMRHMGFQASSIAEAVRIINDMVDPPLRGQGCAGFFFSFFFFFLQIRVVNICGRAYVFF